MPAGGGRGGVGALPSHPDRAGARSGTGTGCLALPGPSGGVPRGGATTASRRPGATHHDRGRRHPPSARETDAREVEEEGNKLGYEEDPGLRAGEGARRREPGGARSRRAPEDRRQEPLVEHRRSLRGSRPASGRLRGFAAGPDRRGARARAQVAACRGEGEGPGRAGHGGAAPADRHRGARARPGAGRGARSRGRAGIRAAPRGALDRRDPRRRRARPAPGARTGPGRSRAGSRTRAGSTCSRTGARAPSPPSDPPRPRPKRPLPWRPHRPSPRRLLHLPRRRPRRAA